MNHIREFRTEQMVGQCLTAIRDRDAIHWARWSGRLYGFFDGTRPHEFSLDYDQAEQGLRFCIEELYRLARIVGLE